MWITSTVTHFLTDVSQGTSPNFSKDWCTRELIYPIHILVDAKGSLFQREQLCCYKCQWLKDQDNSKVVCQTQDPTAVRQPCTIHSGSPGGNAGSLISGMQRTWMWFTINDGAQSMNITEIISMWDWWRCWLLGIWAGNNKKIDESHNVQSHTHLTPYISYPYRIEMLYASPKTIY